MASFDKSVRDRAKVIIGTIPLSGQHDWHARDVVQGCVTTFVPDKRNAQLFVHKIGNKVGKMMMSVVRRNHFAACGQSSRLRQSCGLKITVGQER